MSSTKKSQTIIATFYAILISCLMASTAAQFKMVDSASFRTAGLQSSSSSSPQVPPAAAFSGRLRILDDSNITFVQLNHIITTTTTSSKAITAPTRSSLPPITTESLVTAETATDELKRHQHENAVRVVEEEINTPATEVNFIATIPPTTGRYASTERIIKIFIESPSQDTTTESQILRIGKFRESMNKLNRGPGSFVMSQRRRFYDSNAPMIQIRTLSPLRKYARTVPTKKTVRERVINDRVVDIKPLKYFKKLAKYKSKCRCAKISNCPRLQMSVARCPADYFMCCF